MADKRIGELPLIEDLDDESFLWLNNKAQQDILPAHR